MIRVGSTVTMLRTYALDHARADSPRIERGARVRVTRVVQARYSTRIRLYHVSDGAIEIGPLPAHVVRAA